MELTRTRVRIRPGSGKGPATKTDPDPNFEKKKPGFGPELISFLLKFELTRFQISQLEEITGSGSVREKKPEPPSKKFGSYLQVKLLFGFDHQEKPR